MAESLDRKRVAVRPPEYFPRLAYLALVVSVDTFVLADTFQYSNKSYQNRARLRSPQGWHWISVPLHGKQHGRPLREVEIENKRKWTRSHRRSFEYNYRSSPYFEYYEDDFTTVFDETWERLAPLTCASIERLHTLLDLETKIVRASELDGTPGTVPEVLAALDEDTTLVAPPDAAAHDAPLVDALSVFHFEEPTYHQNFDGFEQGMSAADMLFNYGPETVRMLRDHASIEAPEMPVGS